MICRWFETEITQLWYDRLLCSVISALGFEPRNRQFGEAAARCWDGYEDVNLRDYCSGYNCLICTFKSLWIDVCLKRRLLISNGNGACINYFVKIWNSTMSPTSLILILTLNKSNDLTHRSFYCFHSTCHFVEKMIWIEWFLLKIKPSDAPILSDVGRGRRIPNVLVDYTT